MVECGFIRDPTTKRSYQRRILLRKQQLELAREDSVSSSSIVVMTDLTAESDWSFRGAVWFATRCVLTLSMLLACGDVIRLSFDEKTFCFFFSLAFKGLSYNDYASCVAATNQVLVPLFYVANALAVLGKIVVIWRLAVSFFANLATK